MIQKQWRKSTLNYSAISIVIPAYNEEKTIGSVLDETISVMDNLRFPYEIIVVDDGSTDKTGLIASKYKTQLISNKRNRGKGHCIRKAIQNSHGEIIVLIDSDGQHQPKEIPTLIEPLLNGTDVVSGSRFLGKTVISTSRLNRIGNFFFNVSIMVITGRRITDSQTGFRALKRSVIRKLGLKSEGFEIDAEITVKSLRNGFVYEERPITTILRKYQVSRLRLLSDAPKILAAILKSRLNPLP